MKLIIAGSRDISPTTAQIDACLDKFFIKKFDIDEVVSGTARGGDKAGEAWAERYEINCFQMPANWKKYGKAAGIIRNERMGYYADAALVFIHNASRGSTHMANFMIGLKKPTYIVFVENGKIICLADFN